MLFSIQTFEEPIAFLLLLFFPIYAVLKYYFRLKRNPVQYSPRIFFFQRRKNKVDFDIRNDSELQSKNHFLFDTNCKSPRFWGYIVSKGCIIFAGILLICALARPYGKSLYDIRAEGIDIFLVLDMSGSMLAYDADIQAVRESFAQNEPMPNRFENAISVLQDFVEQRQKPCLLPETGKLPRCDRIGMVVFADEAFLQFPLTTDYKTILHILAHSRHGDISSSHTAIGDAIARAVAGLRHSDAKSKTVVLITDGEQNAGNITIAQAIEAAQLYKIPVYPILVGKNSKTVVDFGLKGKHDFQYTSMGTDWPLLQEIALKTGGLAYKSEDVQNITHNLHEILNQLERNISSHPWDTNHENLAFPCMELALLLLLLGLGLRYTYVRVWP